MRPLVEKSYQHKRQGLKETSHYSLITQTMQLAITYHLTSLEKPSRCYDLIQNVFLQRHFDRRDLCKMTLQSSSVLC